MSILNLVVLQIKIVSKMPKHNLRWCICCISLKSHKIMSFLCLVGFLWLNWQNTFIVHSFHLWFFLFLFLCLLFLLLVFLSFYLCLIDLPPLIILYWYFFLPFFILYVFLSFSPSFLFHLFSLETQNKLSFFPFFFSTLFLSFFLSFFLLTFLSFLLLYSFLFSFFHSFCSYLP